jgi:hypothetical protein
MVVASLKILRHNFPRGTVEQHATPRQKTDIQPTFQRPHQEKKVNVYLTSLMMKVPDHVYVLG